MSLKLKLRSWTLVMLYRVLMATWRIQYIEDERFAQHLYYRKPVIMAHWHGDDFALLHTAKRYRLATMTSHSKDGEAMNFLLRHLGVITTRGSSSKGGSEGFRRLLTICHRYQRNVSFAVDGPRGPLHEVKAGVFEFSRLMKMPIFVVNVRSTRQWVFDNAWNKAILPKPFAKLTVFVKFGCPVISKDVNPRSERLAQQLKKSMSI